VFWLRTDVVARSSYRCLRPNKALQLTGKGRTCGDPAFIWHQPLGLRSNTMAALTGSLAPRRYSSPMDGILEASLLSQKAGFRWIQSAYAGQNAGSGKI
jgi:hypothetical protein